MRRQLYELIPEEGKHLADSHDTEGAVRGVYLDNETNKPCGAGEFMPINIEDSDLISDHTPGIDLAEDNFALADMAIGIVIGMAVTKVFPYVKRWVTTMAVPGVKKFWQKVILKRSKPKKSIECSKPESVSILMKPEEFSKSIDSAVNEFRADMSSEEAQQHLLNIMCAAMCMANEIRQLSNAVLNDEDRLVWKDTLEKLTTQSVTDGINRILEGKVLALDKAQAEVLTEFLGDALITNGVFVPVGNGHIKEALLVHPCNSKEDKFL